MSADPDGAARADESDAPAATRSHWWPRSRDGRRALIAFLILFLLAQPPVVHGFANRIEPRVAGMPFLFVYLFIIYSLQIVVLIHAQRRGV